jgi:quercetin dioxygenase-like cupin family protein
VTEFNQGFDRAGIKLMHHFGDDGSGVYVKETLIPAGTELAMHTHTHTHKSVLCIGVVRLTAGDDVREVVGPAVLTVKQGVPHRVVALTDCAWLCVHASDETDPERIDHTLTGG